MNFHDHELGPCGHGSLLSRAMHGLVAARLGYSETALGVTFGAPWRRLIPAPPTWPLTVACRSPAPGGVRLTAAVGFAGLAVRSDGDPPSTRNCRRVGAALASAFNGVAN